MNLPASITFEQTLLGHGDSITVRGRENGQPVIVKSPDVIDDFIERSQLEYESKQGRGSQQFESEKEREKQVAGQSDYYLNGRLERHEGALFWVRPYVDRSLHDKVEFKEKPSSTELGHICRVIIRALSELNEVDQAGHGNLSLENVLISGDDARNLKLVDLREANKGNTRADQRALGLIIYQLVNGEFVGLDEMISSVPEGQDWGVLGVASLKWTEFCSELLNPYGKYAQSNWKQIEEDLRGICASQSKGLKVSIIVSLLLLCGAGMFFIWKSNSNQDQIVVDLSTIQGQWLELLDEYFSWGGNYLRSKGDFEHARDSPEFIERFYDGKKARISLQIIGRVSGQGVRMQTAPAEVHEMAKVIDVLLLDKNKQQQIALAHQFLIGLRGEIENWEVRRELSEAHASFVTSGFELGAKETRFLLDSISFEDGSLSLSRLYALQTSAAGLGELQDWYARFDVLLTDLRQSQSGFLLAYADDSERRLEQLAGDTVGQLRILVDAASALWTFWKTEQALIEQSLFADQERTFLAESNFAVSDDSLLEWQAMVESFRLIEIPLLEEARAQFSANRQVFNQLTEQINELQEAGVEAVAYDQEFTQLFQRFGVETQLPTIASNRETIESLVRANLSALGTLLGKAESRWAEVNPDIGERLKQLSLRPSTLTGALLAAWEVYLEREVRVRTEDSFNGPREYIVFQRVHEAKLKNFEDFQQLYLSRVSNEWGGRIGDHIRKDLMSALEETRQSYYHRFVSEWVKDSVPALLSVPVGRSLREQAQVYVERMQAYEAKLLAYAQLLGDTLHELDSWDMPDGGIVTRWGLLNDVDAYANWGQSAAFESYHQQVLMYYELEQQSTVGELLAIAIDDSQPGFARMQALRSSSRLEALTPDALGQVAMVIPALREQVPSTKLKVFESILQVIWARSFENQALNRSARELVISHSDVMGVRAADLDGSSRINFEIYTVLKSLRSNESLYTEKPALLAEIINTLHSLPDDSRNASLESLVGEMREVDLGQVKATFENAAFLAMDWVLESETEEQLVLRWGAHQLVFYRIEDEQGDFFLAEQECSIGLFNDWMSAKQRWEQSADSLPREWEIFISQRYSAMDDYRLGMRLWGIARQGLKRGGLEVSDAWFLVDTVVMDEYERIEAEVFPAASLSEALPMQHVGARLARTFAESMGMALPTLGQWKLAVDGHSGADAYLWQKRMESTLSRGLVRELRDGSFYTQAKITESGFGNNHDEILSTVNGNANNQFKHLAGNVAEYLYNPIDNAYYVAGGSALSAVADTWKTEHLLSKRVESMAFSDVGIRLALIAPEQSAYNQFIAILEAAWK